MARVVLLLMMGLMSAAGQLREVTIELEPTGCATCTQSLPERMGRVRGVAEAKFLESPARVMVKLERENRVRLTRLLDVVRQDGTGIRGVALTAAGEAFEDGGWKFRVLAGDAALAWAGKPPVESGRWLVEGKLDAAGTSIRVEKAEQLP